MPLTPPVDRRFLAAAGLGIVVSLLAAGWMLTAGPQQLTGRAGLADFYDAQARSWMDGRWDIAPEVLKVEAFVVDGRSYTYFGPTPALLRLPVTALTDRFDGRLTQSSILLASAVALAATTSLHWRIRCWLRPAAGRPGPRELLVVGLYTTAVGIGSPLLFLSSRAIVYHEAIAWGVALALAGFVAALRWWERPTPGRLLLAGTVAALALLARGSVGAAPLVALALLLLLRVGTEREHRRVSTVALGAVALLLPLGAYAAVNQVKFGDPVSVPFESQVVTRIDEHRREVLAENDGTIFGARYLPSTVLHYGRPDAVRADALFPFVDLPLATVLGDVTFDHVDRSSSVPSSAPLLVALAVPGAVLLARRRSNRPLLALVAGGLCATVPTLLIGFIAHRYLADFLPALVVASAACLHALAPRRGTWGLPVFVAGAALSLALSGALTLVHQRQWQVDVDEDLRAQFVRWQYAVAPRLGDGPGLGSGAGLPAEPAPAGTFWVVGDCDGLYWSSGLGWEPVERTRATGRFRFEIPTTERREGTIVTGVDATVRPGGDGRTRLELAAGAERGTIEVGTGEPVQVEVLADDRLGFLQVTVGADRVVLDTFLPERRGDRIVGTAYRDTALADRDVDVCREVRDSQG